MKKIKTNLLESLVPIGLLIVVFIIYPIYSIMKATVENTDHLNEVFSEEI